VLRGSSVAQSPLSGLRPAGVGVGCGALAITVGVAFPEMGSPGGFLAIAGLCILATALLPFVLRGGSSLLLRCAGAGRLLMCLNLREIRATLPDVQTAGGALLIAVAASIGIGLMVESLRHGFDSMIAQRLAADVVIDAGAGRFTAADIQEVAAHPDVLDVRGYRQADARLVGSGSAELQIAMLDDWELGRYGIDAPFRPGTVYLSEPAALLYGLADANRVHVEGAAGSRDYLVGGVFRDYGSARPRVLIDARDADSLVLDEQPRRLSLRLVQGTDAAGFLAFAVERDWRPQTLAELRATSQQTFTRTFLISDALAALALLVATVGLYNALASLLLKRRAELRLLHALGFDPGALMRMGLAQAVLLAMLLTLAAIPLGAGIGWLLCTVVNPRAFGWSIPFLLSMRPVALPVLLGLLAAAAAGAMPAWRSAHLEVDHD
jgi:putative ABC transport system permease protein